MATDVGSIFLEVFADTKLLKAQIRQAAKQAGKDFGKDFGDEAEKSMAPGLSRIARRMTKDLGADSGRLTAEQFWKSFEKNTKAVNLGFDEDIVRAASDQNWGPLLGNLDQMEKRAETIRARLREWDAELGGTDTRFLEMEANLNAFVKSVQNGEKKIADLEKAEARAAREAAFLAEEEKRIAQELSKAAKEAEVFDRALKDAYSAKHRKDVLELKFEMSDMNDEVRESIRELDALARKKFGGNLTGEALALREALAAVQGEIKDIDRELARARSLDIDADTTGLNAHLKELKVRLAELRATDVIIDIKADLDLPSSAEVRTRGALLGKAFKSAFDKASDGTGGNTFQKMSNRWNEFLTAFPAGVTVLGRYIIGIAGPLSALISGLLAQILAVISSVAGALLALGGVAASVLPGIALGAVLALQAFQKFNEGVGESGKALKELKDSWAKNEVGTFIKQWDAPLASFLTTLRQVIEQSHIAEGLGKAFGAVTAAFEGVVASPAFKTFLDALGTTIPQSIVNLGTGLAPVFEAILEVLNAIQPLVLEVTDQFKVWGESFKESVDKGLADGSLVDFFTKGKEALDLFLGIAGNVGGILSSVFQAGIGPGNELLGMINDLLGRLNDFFKTPEGQKALTDFFESGVQLAKDLGPLLGEIGGLIASLVTPESISNLGDLLDTIAEIVPIVGELLATLAEAGVLNLFAEAVLGIAQAIEPLIPFLGDFIEFLNSLPPEVITALGVAFLALAGALQLISALAGPISAVVTLLGGWAAVGEVLGAALAAIGGPITLIIAGIAALVAALVWFFTKTETGKEIVAAAWQGIQDAAQAVADWFTGTLLPLFQGVWDGITSGIQAVGDFFGNVWQGVLDAPQAIVDWFTGTFLPFFFNLPSLLVQAFLDLITLFFSLPGRIIGAVATLGALLVAWITDAWTAVVTFVTDAFIAYVTFWVELPGRIISAVTTFGPMILEWIVNAWNTVVSWVTNAFVAYVNFWLQLPGRIISAVAEFAPKILRWIIDAWTAVANWINSALNTFVNFFANLGSRVFDALASFGSKILEAISKGMGQGNTAAEDGIRNLLSTIGALPGKIVSTLGNLGSTLYNAGKDLIDGLLRGITAGFDKVKNFVGGVGGWIADHKGPKQYDLHLLQPAGGWIMEGLRKGLQDAIPDLRRTLGNVTDAIRVGTPGTLGVSAVRPAGVVGQQTGFGGGGTTVASGAIQIVTPVKDPAIVASMVLDGLVTRAQ